MITVQIKGTAETIKKLSMFQNEIIKKLEDSMTRISLYMEGEIKQSIAGQRDEPRSVDTGRFLNSIRGESSELGATITSDVTYAPYLEYGTSKIQARRHFRNSLYRNIDKIKNHLQEAIK